MDPDYIESLLVWKEGGASDAVREWLIDQGFHVTPMRAGLLCPEFKYTLGII